MRSRAARCAIRGFLSVEQNAVGNTYSGGPQATTDAVLAFDLDTGRMRWAHQLNPGQRDVFDEQHNWFDAGDCALLARARAGLSYFS